MSFRLFIYHCALCGAWAALVGWALGRMLSPMGGVAEAGMKGLFLGTWVALGLSLVDALWVGSLRKGGTIIWQLLVAVAVGCGGGWLGGTVGQALYEQTDQALVKDLFLVLGWTITGLLIGASVGVFDVLTRLLRGQERSGARRKLVNGVIGGTLGGLLGGILSVVLGGAWVGLFENQDRDDLWSPSALGFVVLGTAIGLLMALAQVILREAWLRVEAGPRAGRELLLSKPEFTIGRAESCDLGLFGDPTVERLHAHIRRQAEGFVLSDAGTPGGTYLNGAAVAGPTPLHSGDAIRIGSSVLRFGERHQRRS